MHKAELIIIHHFVNKNLAMNEEREKEIKWTVLKPQKEHKK